MSYPKGDQSWVFTDRTDVEADRLKTTQKVTQEVNVDHSIVNQYLKQIGKVKKLNKWVPHKLRQI